MHPLHRSELRKFSPKALAEMAIDILAILTEWESLDLIQQAQAERRAAMMGEEVEVQLTAPALASPAPSPSAPNASARQ